MGRYYLAKVNGKRIQRYRKCADCNGYGAFYLARDCRENFNEQNVKSFASTYRAGAKYSYPEIKHGRLNLSRQRHTE